MIFCNQGFNNNSRDGKKFKRREKIKSNYILFYAYILKNRMKNRNRFLTNKGKIVGGKSKFLAYSELLGSEGNRLFNRSRQGIKGTPYKPIKDQDKFLSNRQQSLDQKHIRNLQIKAAQKVQEMQGTISMQRKMWQITLDNLRQKKGSKNYQQIKTEQEGQKICQNIQNSKMIRVYAKHHPQRDKQNANCRIQYPRAHKSYSKHSQNSHRYNQTAEISYDTQSFSRNHSKLRLQTTGPVRCSGKSPRSVQNKLAKIVRSAWPHREYSEAIKHTYYISNLKKAILEINQDKNFQPIIEHFIDTLGTVSHFKLFKAPPHPHLTITLPKKKDQLTLIFDMDQTLLHSKVEQNAQREGQCIRLLREGVPYKIGVKVRPHAKEVLSRLKGKFQLGLFTAANQEYAQQALKILDPEDSIFSFRLFRQHCLTLPESNVSLKDLRVLGSHDLRDVLLIDNSSHCYILQPENGVPILPYCGQSEDKELLLLEEFLGQVEYNYRLRPPQHRDVRRQISGYFQMHRYLHYQTLEEIAHELF